MQAWKRVHQRIEEYEQSKACRESVEAYFIRVKKSDISSLLHEKQVSAHQEQVRKKRQVMEHIIDCSAGAALPVETWLTSQTNDVTAYVQTRGI